MSAAIEFDVQLDTSIIEAIVRSITNAGRTLEKPLAQAGVYMHGSINRNFKAQGRPTSWKGLSKRTLAQRRRGRGVGTAQILQDTGILRASVSSRTARGSVWQLKHDSIKVGTNVAYAGTHQHGRKAIPNVKQRVRQHQRKLNSGETTTVRAHERTVTLPPVPARPFLVFQVPEDVDAITELFSRHFFDEVAD